MGAGHLITSGADTICDPLDLNKLQINAGLEGVEFQLVIITVGSQSEQAEATLIKNSHQYWSVKYAEEIPQVVESVVTDPIGEYYGYYGGHRP